MKKKSLLFILGLFLLTGCTLPTLDGNATGRQGGRTTPEEQTDPNPTGLIESISLNYSTYDLPINKVIKLNPTILPTTAKNKTVVWESSKTDVATVTQTGHVSGLSLGQTTIKCSSTDGSGISAECIVNVVEIPVTDITLSNTSYELEIGSTFNLSATVSPSDATNKDVEFSSTTTNVTIQEMNNNVCKITAKSEGTADILVKSHDNKVTKTCSVTVTPVKLKGFEIGIENINLKLNKTYTLNPTFTPSNASNKTVNWSIGDTSIATISGNVITAKKAGTTVLTGTTIDGGFVDTANINCSTEDTTIHVTGFEIGVEDINLKVNKTYTLNPTITPSNASNKTINWSIGDTSIATISGNKITAEAVGTTTVTGTTEDGGLVDTANIIVTESSSGTLEKTALKYNYDDLTKNYYFTKGATPTTGKAKILVVPIWFSDSTNFIATANKEQVRQDIDKSFFGEVEGYYSVSEFYDIESYGNLKIEGVTTDWYELNATYSSYGTSYTKTESLVTTVMSYAKSNWGINTKDYDMDGDGHVDGLIMIYGGPDCSEYGNSKYENLWAYTTWTGKARNTSNPQVNHFFWSSYDFMYGSNAKTRTGKSTYGGGNTNYCELDTHTFIHEFGHMLGLDDYYDYTNTYSPAAGFSMQDCNVGAHDPFSVMALGWTNPYIPTESCTIEVNPFQESGDLILLSPQWNSDDSPFDEYILLELYTPTRLNELDSKYNLYSGYPQGPSSAGIRVWHVDARLAYSSGSTFSTSKMTTNPSTSLGKCREAMSNTYDAEYNAFGSSTYTNYNLLQYIRKTNSGTTKPKDDLKASTMFTTGNQFSLSTYKSQFPKSTTLNSGSSFPWTVSFDSVSSSRAVITLTYNA